VKDGQNITSSVNPEIQLLNGGQQLRIANAFSSHRGVYTCMAENKVGSALATHLVEVVLRPEMMSSTQEVVHAVEGDLVSLTCPVASIDLGTRIEWRRDGDQGPLESGNSYTISNPPSPPRLTLLSAKDADEGAYSCVVRNDAGENRVDFQLVVWVKPAINIPEGKRTVEEGESLSLDWYDMMTVIF